VRRFTKTEKVAIGVGVILLISILDYFSNSSATSAAGHSAVSQVEALQQMAQAYAQDARDPNHLTMLFDASKFLQDVSAAGHKVSDYCRRAPGEGCEKLKVAIVAYTNFASAYAAMEEPTLDTQLRSTQRDLVEMSFQNAIKATKDVQAVVQ